jgi:hypothetical protein
VVVVVEKKCGREELLAAEWRRRSKVFRTSTLIASECNTYPPNPP